jgi:uncharacterized protein involved in outer membrane biogenesis
MKKILSYALIALFLLIVLVGTIPFLISWNQYKGIIAKEFSAATGRDLTITGDIHVSLLPTPTVSLDDVVIGNPNGALSKNFATVKNLTVGVEFWPLLSKEFRLTKIMLEQPAITLETMANGQGNWNFQAPQKLNQTANTETTEAQNTQNAFSIDSLTVSGAYIRLVDVTKKTQSTIGPIEGSFQVPSLQGPFTGRGSITFANKMPLRFEATVDELPDEETQPITFKLGLSLLASAATADLKGTIQRGSELNVRVETLVATKNLDKIIDPLPEFLSPKTTLSGVLTYQNQRASMPNLMLTSGGLEMTANLQYDMQQSRPAILLDITQLKAPAEMQASAQLAAEKARLNTDQTPLSVMAQNTFSNATALLDKVWPVVPMDIVLTAAQLNWPGQPALRDVRLAASMGEQSITLQTVQVRMDGDTSIRMAAEFPRQQNGALQQAKIQTQITSADIQKAFSKDQTKKAEAIPLNISTTATLTRQEFILSPLNITQQGETISGQVIYKPKSVPAIHIALKGGALDLDAFLGRQTKAKNAIATDSTAQNTKQTSDPLTKLKDLQAQISVDLASVKYQKKTARNVQVQAQANDRGVTIQKAEIGDLGGMQIKASGSVARISPLSGVSLNAKAQTADLSKTLRALGSETAQNLGASTVDASFKGDANQLQIQAKGVLDQGKFDLQATAKDLDTTPFISGKIVANHPETATIVRNFAKMSPVARFGAFALQADFAKGDQTLQVTNMIVNLGTAGIVRGDVKIKPQNEGRSISADLQAETLNLAALVGETAVASNSNAPQPATVASTKPWSTTPMNLESLRGLQGTVKARIGTLFVKKFKVSDFKLDTEFTPQTIRIKNLSGGLFDAGAFDVNGQLTLAEKNTSHQGNIVLAITKTDAKKLFTALGSNVFEKGQIQAKQTLSFTGQSEAEWVGSLKGSGQIDVSEAVVNGIDLDALAARLDRPNSLSDFAAILDLARAGGQTAIGSMAIPLTVQNGVVQIQDVPVKTQKTEMKLRGLVNLPSKTIDMTGQIAFVEQRNLPQLTLFMRGPIAAPQKSFDTRALTQFYAQKATEKLQKKVSDKLGKMLGVPSQPAPPAPQPLPDALPPSLPEPASKDALKQLGTTLLDNILGGGANNPN